MSKTNYIQKEEQDKGLNAWFEGLIAQLKADHLVLSEKVAATETESFYSTLMSSDLEQIGFLGKSMAQKHFVVKIINDYTKLLGDALPNKLAFDYNDSEVLVWAEVENDEMETLLIKAEAKINAKYHKYGFDLESTIVEVDDNLSIPNHYRVFIS